jgi:hypothetical protein
MEKSRPVKLFITIDTEEDLWDNRQRENNPCNNLLRIPLLQEIFDRYEAIPTYLINYAVASNSTAMRILLKINEAGRCEIGSHCHPWNTPPFTEELNQRNSMLCNLPEDIQFEKLSRLHHLISIVSSAEPVSFRAGRWGIGQSTVKCLNLLKYRVDTSISPFTDWSESYGPDFSGAPRKPYLIELPYNEGFDVGQSLLQVPPSIGFLQPYMRLCGVLRKKLRQKFLRKLRILAFLNKIRLVSYRWLSPEATDLKDMILLTENLMKRGHRFLNMSFHSTSLLLGACPFVKSQSDLDELVRRIDGFLYYAVRNGIEFAPLRDASNAINRMNAFNPF